MKIFRSHKFVILDGAIIGGFIGDIEVGEAKNGGQISIHIHFTSLDIASAVFDTLVEKKEA